MNLKDVMTRDVASVKTDATILEAARMMQKGNIGILPVIENQSTLVGVVTDRDITVRAVTQDRLPSEITVGEVMSRNPTWCKEDETLDDVAE